MNILNRNIFFKVVKADFLVASWQGFDYKNYTYKQYKCGNLSTEICHKYIQIYLKFKTLRKN